MERFVVTKMTWDELEALGYTSVTDYCRFLIKGKKEIPDRIEVYRGEMLCISVNNVKLAATLEPTGRGWQKYTGRRQSKGRGCVKNENSSTGSADA